MNAQQQLTPPAIGEVWPGQGGIYGGLRQYPEGMCHVIFATEDVGRHAYGDYGVSTEATSRTDGRANTAILIARTGKHPAAIAAAAHTADGHADFYLPAIGELHHGWQYAPESFATDWYYISSSQYSADTAYLMDFGDGWLYGSDKDGERVARPVRRFLQ
ncbi:hypothetical protein C4K14_3725 [Pseudomonas chlororaphis subsp. aureofaciens]|uniref:DUF1566 domain-containing protein n=1 Tax=Pseudomonas chlororaphis TaxID=587753 RepID=UPI000F584A48|nr:DUF1566 domain-containing protein [Pseudomonas chlororaphis]AZD86549.1 hypothetical protein C4K14_3725 [Pseudomonas chlororaphis subsp. aureofaciens]